MSITRNSGHGTVTFHRLAAKADSSPAPEHRTKATASTPPARTIAERNVNRSQFTDPATLAFRERTAKAEAPRKVALSEAATEFAERSRISSDAVHVFATLATDYERTNVAPFDDTHEIAKKVGLSDERTRVAKEELTRIGLLNVRCNDQWGRDSLVPCRKFLERGGRW